METVWTTSVMMGQENFRELFKLFLEQLLKHKPRKLLVDSRNAEYVIAPEDQDWLNVNIYPQAAEAGVDSIAFLIGVDIFLSVSLEQLAEDSLKNEMVKSTMQQRFFDNEQAALEWLQPGN